MQSGNGVDLRFELRKEHIVCQPDMLAQVGDELGQPFVERRPGRTGVRRQRVTAGQSVDHGKISVVIVVVGTQRRDALSQNRPPRRCQRNQP